MSAGNPGVLNFLIQLSAPSVPVRIITKIELSKIVGTDLYVLWADLCNRNMETVIKLVDNCPLDVLRDACSRQDYSGRELITQYI